jgi:hypothetical protein
MASIRFTGTFAMEEVAAARRTASSALRISGGGGAIGVTTMTLAPTSATPAVTYGRNAACTAPPFQVVVTYWQTVTYLRTDRDAYDIQQFIQILESFAARY